MAARDVRRWRGRFVFRTGVLPFRPVEMTPKTGQWAVLTGMAVAWYTGARS